MAMSDRLDDPRTATNRTTMVSLVAEMANAVSFHAEDCELCCCPENTVVAVPQPEPGCHTSNFKLPMVLPYAW